MKVNSRFTFDKIRFDRDNEIHLVLDLVAPKAEFQNKRPPLCIIPVLDCSSSMDGTKLHYAKQSLLKLVEHLTSDDYMGLVSFANDATPDAPPQRMTPERKEQLKKRIGDYVVRGCTNLSGGLGLALEMANNADLPESTLTRVVLFTDGHPNRGVTTLPELCTLLEKQMGRATVSMFGYGDDAAQELLDSMAAKGKGNFAYVKDPDSALAAFGKELGGLLSSYGQDIVIGVTPHGGHVISEVLTDAEVDEEVDGLVRIKLPQILSEETISVVVSTKLSKQKSAGPRAVNAFDVKIAYRALDENGKMVDHTVESKAKIQFVKDGEEQAQPTKAVDEIVARAQLVKAQIAAEEAAKRNDFQGASAALHGYQVSAAARGHDHLAQVGAAVGGMYTSSLSYGSSSGRRMSLKRASTRGMGTSSLTAEDQVMLQDAGYVVSNASQVSYATEFSSGANPSPESNVSVDQGSVSIGASSGTPAPTSTVTVGGAVSLGTTGASSGSIIWTGSGTSAGGWGGPPPVAPVIQPPASVPSPVVRRISTGPAPASSNSDKAPGRVKKSRSQRW